MDTMMPPTPPTPSEGADWYTRAGRWLGDLDHPFFDDERQRAVWYEASAIGFQIASLGGYLMGAVVVLVTGHVQLVIAMMMPIVLASFVVMGWTADNKAEYAAGMDDLRRSRGAAVAVVAGVFILAIAVRSLIDGSALTATFAVAAFVGLLASMVMNRATRKRLEAQEAALDDD